MKNTKIIKKNYEFKNFFSKGKYYFGKYIEIYIHENNKKFNKLGIAISKKAGKSVKRNHVKRLIRENYRRFESNIIPGKNILIVWNKKAKIEEVTFLDIQKNMKDAFNKAQILRVENEEN